MAEPTLQTSFIPKRSMSIAAVGARGTSVFLVIGIVLFLASAVVAGVVYANKMRLESAISGKDGLTESLKKARDAYDRDFLKMVTRFDRKLASASTLLSAHTTMVPLFAELNHDTLQTVRFTSFDYSTGDTGPKLQLRGEAKSFQSIALQSSSFVASNKFKDVVFSDLNVDNKGVVVFSLSMTVDPTLVSYLEDNRPN